MDDDSIPEQNFAALHEKIHHSNIVSARGACLTKTNGIMPAWYWLGNKKRPYPMNLEGNCSFKSQPFYSCGGWGDYIFFGHEGFELCHRLLIGFSTPEQHIYSPEPKIFHDYCPPHKNLNNKILAQHASWQVLKFSYTNFHDIRKNWAT